MSSASGLAESDIYTAAVAFIKGEVEVEGDLVEAVRRQLDLASRTWKNRFLDWIGRLAPWRVGQMIQTRRTAADNIRFHYDRSNDFYRQFLDARMVYSCAYFQRPGDSLEAAQSAKLAHICRKLRLQPGERFLDIGCGWGALVVHAASRCGAIATGCTLSHRQSEWAAAAAAREAPGRASIFETDYRDLHGRYDKIASVGMFEHVGGARLLEYFRKVHSLLDGEGLFLNHGITKPAGAHRDAQGMFMARRVFPGTEIVGLDDVVRAAERAGFEILDVENLRRHYALTCRAWVDRLRANRDGCLRAVDVETWRTWQLYLAGSAVAFEDGGLGIHQVLMARRGQAHAPMTREYMYV